MQSTQLTKNVRGINCALCGSIHYWLSANLTPNILTSCLLHWLQRTATHLTKYTVTHCNTLQHTATHWNTLQHGVTWARSKWRKTQKLYAQESRFLCCWTVPNFSMFALYCSALQCVSVSCSVPQFVVVCCSVWCVAATRRCMLFGAEHRPRIQ